VVVVHAGSYSATTASLEAYQKVDGAWLPAFGTMPARIGARGFKDHKVEGDLATPVGMYGLGGTMYGVAPDPGTHYPYHQLVDQDYWNSNPGSPDYNRFVHGTDPGSGSEALWRITPQYNHFAVINYNIPATPDRGSAIFLHVMVPGHATAGCVSVGQTDLVTMLRWLDPGASPRIVLAPDQALSRY
jgi:L,D-peptidoglycan transpeptidase YkuD (ErfK/YbiS/YcfS/YnhG family)